MTKSVEFYFDFISPYSYLAYKKLKFLCLNLRVVVIILKYKSKNKLFNKLFNKLLYKDIKISTVFMYKILLL